MDPLFTFVASAVFYVIFICLWSGAVFGISWIERQLGMEPGLAFKLSAIVGFFVSIWLSRKAASRLARGELFLTASLGAFHDGRLMLAFLPLVGHWFELRPKQESHETK